MHHRNRWARRRWIVALSGVLWLAAPGQKAGLWAEPKQRPRQALALADFQLDLQPRLDDVFANSGEYGRVIDRYLTQSASLRAVCDDFARAAQETLRLVSSGSAQRSGACSAAVGKSYARAQALGQDYLRIGQKLARYHDQIRELDRLGDSVGLTPDYRDKVKQVLKSYAVLLTEYREMKTTFHDELANELRFAGCDPAQLLHKPADGGGQPGDRPDGLPAGFAVAANPSFFGLGQGEPAPPVVAEPVTVVDRTVPLDRPAQVSPPAESGTKSIQQADDPQPRNSILFYVDNTRCRRRQRVFLDGVALGAVAGSERGTFHATAGPHQLCLINQSSGQSSGQSSEQSSEQSSGPGSGQFVGRPVASSGGPPVHPATDDKCGDPGTVRRSYLHEGWTIALRCE